MENYILESSDSRDVHEVIDSTDYKHIYLSSDWHLMKYKYKSEYAKKREKNKINSSKIIEWCKKNIKANDVFMYLGDMGYRWLNKEDSAAVQEIFKSLPGIKILILGNHDRMQGPEFYNDCGFDYVFEELIHGSIIFTHRPVDISKYPDVKLNIHGHIHEQTSYYTILDPSTNINVYPLAYNNKPVSLDYIIRNIQKLSANNEYKPNAGYGEAAVLETKRSNLPDSAFGIPEDRKYPLDTAQHVRSAIKLFGHAEESKKHSLARKIHSAASRYGIEIPDTTQVAKYLKENAIIDDGVKNLVFDMGGVLVGDNTRECLYSNINIPNELVEEIYAYIGLLINSEKSHTMSIDQAREVFPEKYSIYFDDICHCLSEGLYVYEYTYKMLDVLRCRGYKLYYLSNWEKWLYELEYEQFAVITQKFDGGIFSFEVNELKPDVNIYNLLLEKYELIPEETMFFDDKNENIQGAIAANMMAMLFSSEVSPISVMAESEVHQTQSILIKKDDSIEPFDVSNIHWWYASSSRSCSPEKEDYYKTLEDAISSIMSKSEEPDLPEDTEDNTLYIFICNGTRQDLDNCFDPICVGIVSVKPDRSFTWSIQYPITSDDGVFKAVGENSSTDTEDEPSSDEENTESTEEENSDDESGYTDYTEKMSGEDDETDESNKEDDNYSNDESDTIEDVEEAMALNAINPMVGLRKTCIIKLTNPDRTVSNTEYLLSPDIISDKYFAIDENSHICIRNAKYYKDYNVIGIYEYTGNPYRVEKIRKAYREAKTVDESFFYTALTDRVMLTPDQIDFDESFSEINISLMIENVLADMATAHKVYTESIYGEIYDYSPVDVPNRLFNECKTAYGLDLMRSIDGYAIYSNVTHRISSIAESVDLITDDMVKSVIGGF